MSQQLPLKRFGTEREAARFYNVSVKTLQAWRATGKGPSYFKFGRAVRYDLTDNSWIHSCERRSTADQGDLA